MPLPHADVIRAIVQIRRQTPDLAWMLEIPGVADLLIRRAAGNIDDQTFAYRLYQTRWWRTTSDAQRQWSALVSIDPAQAARQRQQMAAHVRQLMGTLGVRGPQRDALWAHGATVPARIADLALSFGWDDTQLTNYLMSFVTWGDEGQNPTGGVAVTMTSIRQLAEQFGVDPRDRRIFRWARDILRGEQTIDGLTETLRQRALARYGDNEQIADVLNRGGTVEDFFGDYRQLIASELEIPEASISLNDPRWRQVLEADRGDGRVSPMTMNQALRYVRSQSEWQNTRQGRHVQALAARNLGTVMGRIAA